MTFEEWMRAHRYRESTISQTQSDLRRAGVAGAARDLNVMNALRRYKTFALEYAVNDQLSGLADQFETGRVKRLPKSKEPRKLVARSFEDHDWEELKHAVENTDDPRDQVLWAMVTTALRIGDVLRVDRKTLAALAGDPDPVLQVEVKGGGTRLVPLGIPEPWLRLAIGVMATRAPNIAQYVCSGGAGDVRGGCAYHRVNRRLKALQRKLALSGRANLHRVRRTIAVHALEETDNLIDVQQMLGHTSMQSTIKYVDEANLRKTKRLQRKIAGLE